MSYDMIVDLHTLGERGRDTRCVQSSMLMLPTLRTARYTHGLLCPSSHCGLAGCQIHMVNGYIQLYPILALD